MPIKIVPSPMMELQIEGHGKIDPVLLDLLRSLQLDARLTEAAKKAGISYRHAWNILRKWNTVFGQPVVVQQRGQGTRLSPLGSKLVWAEQLVDAQLGPQIANLGSLINRELDSLLGNSAASVAIHASHGYAIALVHELLEKEIGHTVSMKYTGSVGAVEALNKGQCQVAGLHIPINHALRQQARTAYQPFLLNHKHRIIKMVIRTQGMMVQAGNPRKIYHIKDLCRPEVSFINRQKSAGTRVLLDSLLGLCQLDKTKIAGYDQEEFTHTAVAAHVASGSVDVGFGIEYAARKFHLDFIPVVDEQYVLACDQAWLSSHAGKQLLHTLKCTAFLQGVDGLAGYRTDEPGATLKVSAFLGTAATGINK